MGVCGNRTALQNSSNLYFLPKTVLAACYYNISSVKKNEFPAEDCHRLASAHLPQGQRDIKIILMMPRSSPASHTVTGQALAEEENQQIWSKKSFIPSSQRLHSELVTTLCLGLCRRNLSRASGDTKKFSFTATTP